MGLSQALFAGVGGLPCALLRTPDICTVVWRPMHSSELFFTVFRNCWFPRVFHFCVLMKEDISYSSERVSILQLKTAILERISDKTLLIFHSSPRKGDEDQWQRVFPQASTLPVRS